MQYPVKAIIDGQPCFEVELQEILGELEHGGALQVLSPVEYLTLQQIRWYKGVALRCMSDATGYTPEECDYILKAECGADLLNRESVYLGKLSSGKPVIVERLTIVGVGKRKMQAFVDNILVNSIDKGWHITPPDPELRSI